MYWKGLDEVDLLRKRAESQDTKAWKQKEAEEEGEEKGWGINPSGQTEAGQNVAAEGSSFCLQILAGCLGSELKIIFWFLYMAHRQPFCAGFSPHREGSFPSHLTLAVSRHHVNKDSIHSILTSSLSVQLHSPSLPLTFLSYSLGRKTDSW